MKLFLRKLYYFPLQTWFVKLVSYFLFKLIDNSHSFKPIKAKNIIIIKLDEIGDFVLATPFLRELRNNYPDSKISLLVKEEVYNLAEFCPYLDDIIPIDLKMNKLLRPVQQYFRLYKIGRKYLWMRNFDLCIIPRWEGDDYYSAFFAKLSGAKFIIGYDQNDGTENLYHLKMKKEKIQHEVEQNLDIIRALNWKINSKNLEIWFTKEDQEYAKSGIKKYKNEILIGLAPGASAAKRIYPVDSYISLIEKVKKESKNEAIFFVFGSKEDKTFGKKIADSFESGIIDFTGKTTLRQAGALIKYCELFVGNDSGLIHIASAVKTPVISIHCHPKNGYKESENAPERFRPWNEIKKIIQPEKPIPPCKYYCGFDAPHCIKQISVDEIYRSIKEILAPKK